MKRIYLFRTFYTLVISLVFSGLNSYAQFPVVDGSKAVYARVENHYSEVNNDPDTLLVNDATGFSIGDTVLFHHTVSGYPYGSTALKGDIFVIRNAGIYAIFLIDNIDGNQVILNNSLPVFGINSHTAGDYGQLIKIPTYNKARLTSSFDFPAWDPASHTGGIFPLLVRKKLVLEDDFSADGKGFQGGEVNGDDYVADGGVCSDGVFGADDNYFTSLATDSGAIKGESFHNKTINLVGLTRGRGRIGTGGGGGNAMFSGGGGGGNKGRGGQGGYESNACTNAADMGGLGGQSLTYDTDPSDVYGNRIHMGGGGGAGTQSPSTSRFGTSGGNGGGIIIIITDTLETSGSRTISANGESVTGIATAGGGGGGAGGVLIMEVSNYIGDLNLEVNGGDGGSISSSPDITGPGGGGGGGVIQHNESSLPSNVNPERSNGNAGVVGSTTNTYNAQNGEIGQRLGDLLIPIRGFILNTIPDDITICEDELPPVLNASKAKGGSGDFTYTWLQSTDTINWTPAAGTNNNITYQPPYLSDTTFYKRYVVDNVSPSISDSGFFMAVNVHQQIENNLISSDDTVCYNLAPGNDLTSVLSLIGGDGGGYDFTWLQSDNNLDYLPASDENSQFDYTVPALTDTVYYKRMVQSGVCTDTSNTVTITVLQNLDNLEISENQFLCNNQTPSSLNGDTPGGGQPGDKRYEWYQTVGGIRSLVGTGEDYQPPALGADNYLYRRIVYSGSEDACIDSSNQISVLVYPDIQGNSISSDKDTICSGLPGITIDGLIPTGGKSGDYNYLWEESPDGTGSWSTAGTNPESEDLLTEDLVSTSYFRRTVFSATTDSACVDMSNVVKVEVLPPLVNTIISNNDTICQNTSAPVITAGPATGGLSGSYDYHWEYRKDNSLWGAAPGITDQQNYSPGILDDTSYYYFRRTVLSGPDNTCSNTSDSIGIFIQPEIKDNALNDPSTRDICYGTKVTLDALAISGGDGSSFYQWQDSISGGSWQAAPGTNDFEDYTSQDITEPVWFRRIASSGKCVNTGSAVFTDTLSLPVLNGLSLNYDTICHDQTDVYLRLEIFSEEGNPADYTIFYSDNINPDVESVLSNNIDSINITGFNPFTSYTYSLISIEDANGCYATQGLSQNIDLWVNKAPVPEIIKPSEPYNICGPYFELSSNPDINPGVSAGWWTVDSSFIEVTDSLAESTSFNHIDNDFDSTTVHVMFNQYTKSCGQRADTLEVKLYEQPLEPVICEGDTLVIFLSDNTELCGEIPTAGFVEWSVLTDEATVEGNGFSATVNNIPIDIETIVRYTVRNGVCNSLSDEILIQRNEVHLFEGISPDNEDGINDYLVAEGLDVDGITFTFQIFSTNGMLVRELTENDIDRLGFETGLENNGRVLWDGKTKNEDNYVPAGTYYYVLVIKYNGTEFIDKGFVVVK